MIKIGDEIPKTVHNHMQIRRRNILIASTDYDVGSLIRTRRQ